MAQTIAKAFLYFIINIFRRWGFDGPKDYIFTVLGIKPTPYFRTQIAAFMVASLLAFISDWIWRPPAAAIIIVVMTLANSYYGYLVAKVVKKELWSWKKFIKTGHIVASDLLAMALLHSIIETYPYYSTGADILFAHLAGFKFKELFVHWAQLDFKKAGLQGILKVLRLSETVELIDKVQQDSPTTPTAPPTPKAKKIIKPKTTSPENATN